MKSNKDDVEGKRLIFGTFLLIFWSSFLLFIAKILHLPGLSQAIFAAQGFGTNVGFIGEFSDVRLRDKGANFVIKAPLSILNFLSDALGKVFD